MEKKLQTLVLEERKRLKVEGVVKIDNFTAEKIKLILSEGSMNITGEGLKVNAFSECTGEFFCEGKIYGIIFSQKRRGIKELLR